MIEVENLGKKYGERYAVQNLNFSVKKGEILGFLGPNGAGKTTTMRILTCYLPANEGTARVAGFDVFKESMQVRKRIGYLPENPPLYREMAVSSFLDFVSRIKGVPRRKRAGRIEYALKRCIINDVKDRLIQHLSKGYRQRVGLAAALVNDPEVLILDEPTIGLDPKQIIEIRELIKSLAGDHTVILSSHILPEVTQTCQRVVIINEGKVVAEDSFENLSERLRKAERISLQVRRDSAEIAEKLGAIEGVVKVSPDGEAAYLIEAKLGSDVREEISSVVVRENWGLLELSPMRMSMEDVFLKLTTEEVGLTESIQ
ncbi:MAG: ATP-binding cassette domain-containing protein [Acidobacteria bacterium]|nr:ATP-binding cassette domain-containing protein [Acidobacteriota bacterium]